MFRTRIILLTVSAAVIGLIFLLPKVVVENENQIGATDSTTSKKEAPAIGHSAIPNQLARLISKLRSEYQKSSSNQKNAIFADSLRTLYTQAMQFDSAAAYAEKAATFFNNKEGYLKAGNSYYEAFTFAVTTDKQKSLADKTRDWLGKAVAQDPKNLEARTKIAMTYLSSPNPMTGIKMMREVLKEDPKNEFALYNMGMLSVQSGQFDKAIERLIILIKVNPNHIQGHLLLGVAYLKSGAKEKAKAQFEKVKKMDGDPAVKATVDSYLEELK